MVTNIPWKNQDSQFPAFVPWKLGAHIVCGRETSEEIRHLFAPVVLHGDAETIRSISKEITLING